MARTAFLSCLRAVRTLQLCYNTVCEDDLDHLDILENPMLALRSDIFMKGDSASRS